ncbi:hypothetical protein AO1008_04773 [Aspergillus oryzae 100-8]|uniref:Uncharacterized protein n=1 Tax=Aspergillus oryzae (strain 3.042) TaxID=1160506 RepID=I8I902_ASPO3|nr:hypothetical protein Ao3042_10348 [Aspergillus oryzae 3.042]KDE78550.1 hypothetical protein AO1008_04773 [Aspergillus oryzae 100-8]|eukprot:EIT73596.1 hypothetical protein Ao3042_10348 [Aspergillus oryzae 3.042]
MATQLDFPALSKQMMGKWTTEGFDILVSYSEEKVNQLLRARSEQLKSILKMGPLETSYVDPLTDETIHLNVFMDLEHPLLQFEDEHGNITLTFDIQKGHYVIIAKNITKDLPSGMAISFKTTLNNVKGTVESSQSEDEPTGKGVKTASANELVIFNPGEKDISQHVCITFEKASADFIGTTEESKKRVAGMAFLLGAVKEYFQQHAELKYFVAGVSNKYNPESGSDSLQPRSFRFNTLKGKTKNDESALCMWISVKEGTNRPESYTQAFEGTFYANGLIPIPRGRTCSLIMHNDLLIKQFIMPNLSKGFKSFKDKTSGKGGLNLSATMIADDIDIKEMKKKESWGPGGIKTTTVDPMKFSLSDPETTISFGDGIISKSNKINYTNKQQVKWKIDTVTGRVPGHEHGTTNLEFKWTATGSWKDKKTPGHPNLLGFDWAGDKNWTITKSAEDVHWWEAFGGASNKIPEPLQNLQVPSPNTKLEMNTLDYFLTTNLLYPGKHIFDADDPSSGSTDKGLAFPHDLILTGETKIK